VFKNQVIMWLERLIVVQEVVGSRPIFHPKIKSFSIWRSFFGLLIRNQLF